MENKKKMRTCEQSERTTWDGEDVVKHLIQDLNWKQRFFSSDWELYLCWMNSLSVPNNFPFVSADARPSCVFWRHNGINKSDPYGAADVFLISLYSTVESQNWLSLQHLPNCEVHVFAALQIKKKKKVSRWAETEGWGSILALRSLCWWNRSRPEAKSLFSRMWW